MMMGVKLPNADSFGIADRSWLWRDWIASGELTILAGEPGSGKSSVSMDIAASVSCGGTLPNGEKAEQGRVIIFNSEDQIRETINPRLIAAGADMKMIHFPTGVEFAGSQTAFDPSSHMRLLQQTLATIQADKVPVRLVIIDPVMAALRGTGTLAVRQSIEALVRFAEKTGCAVLGITHFSKGSSRKTMAERVIGSQATVAVARTVLAAISANETGHRAALLKIKSNHSSLNGYLPYDLDSSAITVGEISLTTSRVVWGEYETRDLFTADDQEGESLFVQACEYLSSRIAKEGVSQREVEAEIAFQPFSLRTVRRAKEVLQVRSKKVGKEWRWFLPNPLST